MRLFYDVSSSRLRAELALLAADAGAVTTVVLFAAGAAFSGAEIPDLALLVVWSAMPVAIARVLRGIEMPREPWRRMLPSAILGLSLAGLIVLGLELIRSVAPGRSVPENDTVHLRIQTRECSEQTLDALQGLEVCGGADEAA